jgi:hypothetical protein
MLQIGGHFLGYKLVEEFVVLVHVMVSVSQCMVCSIGWLVL